MNGIHWLWMAKLPLVPSQRLEVRWPLLSSPSPNADQCTLAVKKVAAETTDASAVPESDASPSEEQAPEGEDTGAASGGGGGAYNPETGEINWDCPCLGGMADGPCGEEFREAFSCFIYSDQEPKGIECVEKFKGMQECFRKHPEVYSDRTSLFTIRILMFDLSMLQKLWTKTLKKRTLLQAYLQWQNRALQQQMHPLPKLSLPQLPPHRFIASYLIHSHLIYIASTPLSLIRCNIFVCIHYAWIFYASKIVNPSCDSFQCFPPLWLTPFIHNEVVKHVLTLKVLYLVPQIPDHPIPQLAILLIIIPFRRSARNECARKPCKADCR